MPAHKRMCSSQSVKQVGDLATSSADAGADSLQFSEIDIQRELTSPANSPYNFSGLGPQDLLVVEICAGTARWTKTVRKRGFKGLAVDKTKDRGCGTEILLLDLTLDTDVQLLIQILSTEAPRIVLVFISPPCGTASKARERPIKTSLLRGAKQPMPLRTKEKPDQKDGLSNMDKFKTEMANQLYDSISRIVLHCTDLGLWVMVENPRNSLYWETSFARKFVELSCTHWVDFHNCAHGGKRDKLTRLWSNKQWGQSLQLFCDKQHTHASWRPTIVDGKLNFPTAEEAAYPWLFCERVVNIVEQVATDSGCNEPATLQEQVEVAPLTNFQRYIFDALPRSSKIKPLVAEFGHFLTLGVNPQNPDYIGNIMQKMPKGTKLLSRRLVPWEKARDETVDKIELDSWQAKGGEGPGESEFDVVELCRIGIPSSPEEFVQRAIMAGHPKDLVGQIGEIMQKTIWLNFHQPPHVLAKLRIEFVKKYSAMALDLRAEELKLKYSMPKHIKEIMKGKRFALWGKILSDLNYPDTDLVQDMVRGFPLSRWMPRSNVFPHEVRHPKITMEALHDSLELFNLKVKQQMSIRQESQLEEDTWEETMKELEKGWIWRDESTSWEGKCVARRFGIHQGGKTRVIDDCSVCGLNQTVGLREKFVLQAVDQMCAIISWSMKQAGVGQHVPIVGRTFDLKAAYKQFGLCSLDRDLVRIAAVDPATGHAALFGLNALPFGVWARWLDSFVFRWQRGSLAWSFGNLLDWLFR